MKKSFSQRGLEARGSSGIPVSKGRSTSLGRDSRSSRTRTVDQSGRKRRSRSQVTPTTPVFQQPDYLYATSSGQSTRSRSGSRCGSAERGFKGRGKVADTRPTSDKNFQKLAMACVYNYFQTQPQAVRSLCPPSNSRTIMIKSFVGIMAHLMEHFFSNHGVYIKNYVEEIPKLMKKLFYPGNLSTSWLKTVNAPHAWPHVVAAMSWLVDLVVQRQSLTMSYFFPANAPGAEAPAINPEIFLKYTMEAFREFNAVNDAEVTAINRRMVKALKEKQQFTDADLAQLEAETNALEAALNDPLEKMAIEELEQSKVELKSWDIKIHEAESACERLEHSNEALKSKLQRAQQQHEQQVKENKFKSEQLERLSETVQNQPMTVDEANVYKDKISMLQRELQNNEAYLLELEKISCSYDMKLPAVKAKLNRMCVEYNKEILQSSEDLHPFKVSTDLNFHEKDLDQALEEMSKIHDGLKQLQEKYKALLKSKTDSIWELEKRIQEKKDQKKKQGEEMEELLVEGKRLTADHAALEARYKKMVADYNREHDAIQTETRQLVDSMPDVEKKRAHLEQLEKRNAAEKVALQELVISIVDYFDDLYKMLTESKNDLLDKIEKE